MALTNQLPQSDQKLVEKIKGRVEAQVLGFTGEEKLELKVSNVFSLILTIAKAECGDQWF